MLYPAVEGDAAPMAGYPHVQAANVRSASCAEGYSFPTNLDRDPPIGRAGAERRRRC